VAKARYVEDDCEQTNAKQSDQSDKDEWPKIVEEEGRKEREGEFQAGRWLLQVVCLASFVFASRQDR
jgi:hypothetical protein